MMNNVFKIEPLFWKPTEHGQNRRLEWWVKLNCIEPPQPGFERGIYNTLKIEKPVWLVAFQIWRRAKRKAEPQ